MKKIIIINGSPRKGANSDFAAEKLAAYLRDAGAESETFTVRDKKVTPCIGCDSCKKTDVCIHRDDMAALNAALETADGIALLTPIYFGGLPGTVKTLIDRFYVFFNPTKPPRALKPKKLGTVLTFGAGPAEAYEKVAEAAAATFGVVGVTEHKNLLFGNQNDRKALAGDAARQQQLRELADYLAK